MKYNDGSSSVHLFLNFKTEFYCLQKIKITFSKVVVAENIFARFAIRKRTNNNKKNMSTLTTIHERMNEEWKQRRRREKNVLWIWLNPWLSI